MHEGDSFDVIASYDVVIPQNPGTLTFRIQNLDFDPTDTPQQINDAFEASFVDTNGNSLVPTFASSRDAFLNITDGQSPALGSGATYDPSTGRISLDISTLAPGSQGTLVLRLVNNDNTTNTSVQIVGDTEAPGVTAQLAEDTAPASSTNPAYTTDGVTTDSTINGTLTGSVTQLLVQQDGGTFQDISSDISGSGFQYTPQNLTAGPHQFTFQVVDAYGVTSTTTLNFTFDLGPGAAIAGSTTTTDGSTLTFNGLASTTDVASMYSYTWEFPDGSDATGPTASYTFPTAGQYPVSLAVTDIAGATSSTSEEITVTNVPSNPTIGGSPTIAQGTPYLLTLSSNPAADPVTSWTINWGDGDTETYSGDPATVSHTYTSASADVTISGTATNDNGTVATNSLDVSVTPVPPTLVISGASSVPDDTPYVLNLAASDPNQVTISSWTINWGDGTVQTVSGNPSSVTHTYTGGPNNYTISASATDANGTYDSNTLPLTVTPAPLGPTISGNPTVNEGDVYTLNLSATDPDQDPISSWTINWGDGFRRRPSQAIRAASPTSSPTRGHTPLTPRLQMIRDRTRQLPCR